MNTHETHAPADHLDKIRVYYTKAQRFYKRMWDERGLHYGFWAPGMNSRAEAVEYENQVLADRADVKPGDWVLDAGCGIGGSGIWLARHKGAHIVEANIVDLQLKEGRKLSEKRKLSHLQHFTGADYHHLPYKDESFDVVWSLESIEHTYDPALFVEEATRVLKPGGRLVIAGTFRGSTAPSEKQKHHLLVGQRVAGVANDFPSATEIETFMDSKGFIRLANTDVTHDVMESSVQMERMCTWALPGAKFAHSIKLVSPEMLDNTAWGTYQRGLFDSGVTTYNIVSGVKPLS